ncbi:Gfo/Idh/MocA family oxidoreductase [bacterium]|nr:Gfo/Idh/MocA family oxidoreductase [bacterium]
MSQKTESGKKILNVGVIGLGHWGPNVARNLANHPRASLKYVCDTNEKAFRKVQSLPLGDCRFVTDPAEVFADRAVQAVAIVTPSSTHYDLTRQALLAGKHVLCEKPFTLLTEQGEELCRLAAERRKKIMVGFTFLYNNAVRKLKTLGDSKTVGKLYYLTSNRSHMGLVRQDVDVIWDLAPHDISIFNYILGAVPEKVAATGAMPLSGNRCDVAFLTLYYPGGVIGHIYLSWLDSNKERLLRLIGDKARVDFDDLNNLEPVRIFRKGIALNGDAEPDFGAFRFLLRDGDIISPKIKMAEPLGQMIDCFVSSILDGKKIMTDGRFAVDITRTLLAAQESLKNNGLQQPVK